MALRRVANASQYLMAAGFLTLLVGIFPKEDWVWVANVGVAVVAAAGGQLFLNALTSDKTTRQDGWHAVINSLLVLAIIAGSALTPTWLGESALIPTFFVCFVLGAFQRKMGWAGVQ